MLLCTLVFFDLRRSEFETLGLILRKGLVGIVPANLVDEHLLTLDELTLSRERRRIYDLVT